MKILLINLLYVFLGLNLISFLTIAILIIMRKKKLINNKNKLNALTNDTLISVLLIIFSIIIVFIVGLYAKEYIVLGIILMNIMLILSLATNISTIKENLI